MTLQNSNATPYKYTQDLLKLDMLTDAAPPSLPPEALSIITPLIHQTWKTSLGPHPDRHYQLSGIQQGFHIGVDRNLALKRSSGNMQSALIHPIPVDEYLLTELRAGRIICPVTDSPLIHMSRFGVIPKSGQPGKWRPILNLSNPHGNSINDAIPKDICSLKYTTVDQAVHHILSCGVGALLAKIDIQHAFRNISVLPSDRKYLGMS